MVTEAVQNAHEVLLSRFLAARAETDALFGIVKPEAMYDRPIPERHRIVFYIGHLEAFDRNLLSNPASAPSEFDRLFAFGIDPVGGNLPTDGPQDWPRLEIVNEYRDQTRDKVDQLLNVAATQADPGGTFEQKINIAIEHRLMHAETLAYIFHQLPFDRKQPARIPGTQAVLSLTPELLNIPAGSTTLGLRRDSGAFGWDNEFEAHTVQVPGFTIEKHKVTNGQFLQFLNDGGYWERSLWTQADWEWRSTQNISHPVSWARHRNGWGYRSMFEELPLPSDWPVYVSHAEASAYARWAGKLLPTEAQWHRAAYGEYGIDGAIATGWEWTSTEFAPFPGFEPMPFYAGYSEPFFDGKHFVLKGGSPGTASVMLRPSFRNWFQPHYQYVYAGFRCAQDVKGTKDHSK
jgi:gamma-glutamyl hercynylcysteine S-oxide synthase